MANDATIPVGSKVKGSGHFKTLKGKVVETNETGFGMKYARVERPDGTSEWARTTYLERLRQFTSEDLTETGFDGS